MKRKNLITFIKKKEKSRVVQNNPNIRIIQDIKMNAAVLIEYEDIAN